MDNLIIKNISEDSEMYKCVPSLKAERCKSISMCKNYVVVYFRQYDWINVDET